MDILGVIVAVRFRGFDIFSVIARVGFLEVWKVFL